MKKLISAFTLGVYLASLPGNGAPAYALNLPVSGPVSGPVSEVPSAGMSGSRDAAVPFAIPPELGTITDFSFNPGRSGPLVVHIQDAHANPGAQENIVRLLEWLKRRTALKTQAGAAAELWVGLEGADGAIHPEYFDFFPDHPEVNDAIVRDLAGKGEIAGGELFAWNQHHQDKSGAVFYGIENPGVYRKNLRTYRTLLFQRGEINLLLDGLHRNFDLAKSQLLSADLQRFLREKKRRRDGDYGGGALNPQLGPYLDMLARQVRERVKIDLQEAVEQLRFPNVVRLLKSQDLLNAAGEEAIAAQRQILFTQIDRKFKPAAARELRQTWQAFEKNHFPRRTLEEFLLKLKNARVDLNALPALASRAGALMLQTEIDAGKLSDETELLEYWITERLIQSDSERDLLGLLERFDLLENILLGKLTNGEFEKVLRYGRELAPSALDRNLRALPLELPPLDKKNVTLEKYFHEALVFYHTAVTRDNILTEHFLNGPGASGDASPPALGVLIAGGFHTTGIADSLARRGFNYVVVRPRMQAEDHGKLYEKVMRDDHARFPAFFDAPELTKQEILLLRGLIETGIPALKELGGLSEAAAAQLALESINRHPVLAGRIHASLENTGVLEKLRIFYKTKPVKKGPAAGAPDGYVRHNSGLGGASLQSASGSDGATDTTVLASGKGRNATVRDTVLMVTPAVFSEMRARVGARRPSMRTHGEQLLAEITVSSGLERETAGPDKQVRSENRKSDSEEMPLGVKMAIFAVVVGIAIGVTPFLIRSLQHVGQERLKQPAAKQPVIPDSPFDGKIRKAEPRQARSEYRRTPDTPERSQGRQIVLGLAAVAFIFLLTQAALYFSRPAQNAKPAKPPVQVPVKPKSPFDERIFKEGEKKFEKAAPAPKPAVPVPEPVEPAPPEEKKKKEPPAPAPVFVETMLAQSPWWQPADPVLHTTIRSEMRSGLVTSPADTYHQIELLRDLGFTEIPDTDPRFLSFNATLREKRILPVFIDSWFMRDTPRSLMDLSDLLKEMNIHGPHAVTANLGVSYVGLAGAKPEETSLRDFLNQKTVILQGLLRGRHQTDDRVFLPNPWADSEILATIASLRRFETKPAKKNRALEHLIGTMTAQFATHLPAAEGDQVRQSVQTRLQSLLLKSYLVFHYTSEYGDIKLMGDHPDANELGAFIRAAQKAQHAGIQRNGAPLQQVVLATFLKTGRVYTDSERQDSHIHDKLLNYLRDLAARNEINFLDLQQGANLQEVPPSNRSPVTVINFPNFDSRTFNRLYAASDMAVVAGDMGLRYMATLAGQHVGPLTLFFPHHHSQADMGSQFREQLKAHAEPEVLELLQSYFDLQNVAHTSTEVQYDAFADKLADLMQHRETADLFRNQMGHLADNRRNMFNYFLGLAQALDQGHFTDAADFNRVWAAQNRKRLTHFEPREGLELEPIRLRNHVLMPVLRDLITGFGDAAFLKHLVESAIKAGVNLDGQRIFMLLADVHTGIMADGLERYELVAKGTPADMEHMIFVLITKNAAEAGTPYSFHFFERKNQQELIREVRKKVHRSEMRSDDGDAAELPQINVGLVSPMRLNLSVMNQLAAGVSAIHLSSAPGEKVLEQIAGGASAVDLSNLFGKMAGQSLANHDNSDAGLLEMLRETEVVVVSSRLSEGMTYTEYHTAFIQLAKRLAAALTALRAAGNTERRIFILRDYLGLEQSNEFYNVMNSVLLSRGVDPKNFDVVFQPNFGQRDDAGRLNDHRIVIGLRDVDASKPSSGASREATRALLERLYPAGKIDFINVRSAELAYEAYLTLSAAKLAHFRGLAPLAEAIGGNVYEAAFGAGLDGRIGFRFINPSLAFGGELALQLDWMRQSRIRQLADALDIPEKEVADRFKRALLGARNPEGGIDLSQGRLQALLQSWAALAPRLDARMLYLPLLLELIRTLNEESIAESAEKILAALAGKKIDDASVGILGVGFKENETQITESPVLPLIEKLVRAGIRQFMISDPKAGAAFRAWIQKKRESDARYEGVVFSGMETGMAPVGLYEVAAKADITVVAQESHPELKQIDLTKLTDNLKGRPFFDGIGLFGRRANGSEALYSFAALKAQTTPLRLISLGRPELNRLEDSRVFKSTADIHAAGAGFSAKRITVLGGGYVGLVTAAKLAELGHEVWVYEPVAAKVAMLDQAPDQIKTPIYEPGLQELIRDMARLGRFHATGNLALALDGSDHVYAAVPTPQSDDGAADLSYLKAAAESFAKEWVRIRKESPDHIPQHPVAFTIKSTVPSEAIAVVKKAFDEAGLKWGEEAVAVSNPEFLREGSAMNDVSRPDRTVFGIPAGLTAEARAALEQEFLQIFYPLMQAHPHEILFTTPEVSTMIKYAANAMLALSITASTVLSNEAVLHKADFNEVIAVLQKLDPIGARAFIFPGCWGGSCFPKDTRAVSTESRGITEGKKSLPLVQFADGMNDVLKQEAVEEAARLLGGSLRGKTLAFWGMTFKPETDDVRETVSASAAYLALSRGVREIRVHDPIGREESIARIWQNFIAEIAKVAFHDPRFSEAAALFFYDAPEAFSTRILQALFVRLRGPAFGAIFKDYFKLDDAAFQRDYSRWFSPGTDLSELWRAESAEKAKIAEHLQVLMRGRQMAGRATPAFVRQAFLETYFHEVFLKREDRGVFQDRVVYSAAVEDSVRLTGAHPVEALLVLTNWNDYRLANFAELLDLNGGHLKALVDARGFFDREAQAGDFANLGVAYSSNRIPLIPARAEMRTSTPPAFLEHGLRAPLSTETFAASAADFSAAVSSVTLPEGMILAARWGGDIFANAEDVARQESMLLSAVVAALILDILRDQRRDAAFTAAVRALAKAELGPYAGLFLDAAEAPLRLIFPSDSREIPEGIQALLALSSRQDQITVLTNETLADARRQYDLFVEKLRGRFGSHLLTPAQFQILPAGTDGSDLMRQLERSATSPFDGNTGVTLRDPRWISASRYLGERRFRFDARLLSRDAAILLTAALLRRKLPESTAAVMDLEKTALDQGIRAGDLITRLENFMQKFRQLSVSA